MRSQTIVNPSLIAKTKPMRNYREEAFCLGIVGWCRGWCPCSDCASFSLDSIPRLQDSFDASMETRYSKTLKQKRTGDLEGITKQKCSEPTRDQSNSSSSIVRSLVDDDIDMDRDVRRY